MPPSLFVGQPIAHRRLTHTIHCIAWLVQAARLQALAEQAEAEEKERLEAEAEVARIKAEKEAAEAKAAEEAAETARLQAEREAEEQRLAEEAAEAARIKAEREAAEAAAAEEAAETARMKAEQERAEAEAAAAEVRRLGKSHSPYTCTLVSALPSAVGATSTAAVVVAVVASGSSRCIPFSPSSTNPLKGLPGWAPRTAHCTSLSDPHDPLRHQRSSHRPSVLHPQ